MEKKYFDALCEIVATLKACGMQDILERLAEGEESDFERILEDVEKEGFSR